MSYKFNYFFPVNFFKSFLRFSSSSFFVTSETLLESKLSSSSRSKGFLFTSSGCPNKSASLSLLGWQRAAFRKS